MKIHTIIQIIDLRVDSKKNLKVTILKTVEHLQLQALYMYDLFFFLITKIDFINIRNSL